MRQKLYRKIDATYDSEIYLSFSENWEAPSLPETNSGYDPGTYRVK